VNRVGSEEVKEEKSEKRRNCEYARVPNGQSESEGV
jgi:hypothetical protein